MQLDCDLEPFSFNRSSQLCVGNVWISKTIADQITTLYTLRILSCTWSANGNICHWECSPCHYNQLFLPSYDLWTSWVLLTQKCGYSYHDRSFVIMSSLRSVGAGGHFIAILEAARMTCGSFGVWEAARIGPCHHSQLNHAKPGAMVSVFRTWLLKLRKYEAIEISSHHSIDIQDQALQKRVWLQTKIWNSTRTYELRPSKQLLTSFINSKQLGTVLLHFCLRLTKGHGFGGSFSDASEQSQAPLQSSSS